MGISDRDYMKSSSDDRKRVEAYEKAARKKEYGDSEFRRRSTLQKVGLVIITIFALLALLAAIF